MNIFSTAPITYAQAALGGEVRISTVDGEVAYDVKPGTQTDTRIRLKGRESHLCAIKMSERRSLCDSGGTGADKSEQKKPGRRCGDLMRHVEIRPPLRRILRLKRRKKEKKKLHG